MMIRKTYSQRKAQGAILLVSLILLLAMTMIGVAAIDSSSLQSQMSRNTLESLTRYQTTMNEIQAQYQRTLGWEYREGIRNSSKTIANTPVGITYTGPGLDLIDAATTTAANSQPVVTHDATDAYDQSGNLVFSGENNGAFNGYSLNKNKFFSYEVNVITSLQNTNSLTDQTQGILHAAPSD